MNSIEIRQKFLDFFRTKDHKLVPSASILIKDDPTLLFTNAGMNPFKDYFLGNATPQSLRIANSQKCLRVSGKHNDLEEVGIDTYHHTFFEMLGNWSFGDYFKKEAITWAWELITEIYKIDKEDLYITVFGGEDAENLAMDKEAYEFWKEIVPQERILMGSKKDNFWEMGAQGPCGPCSELHVDIRSKEEKKRIKGEDLVNKDHPQVIEVWNLVFIEFNRKKDGELEKLSKKHIDTGMGLERLAMVLQEVKSNYDTDIFTPLIREVTTITGNDYGKDTKTDIAIRVIVDHIRAVYFTIADGQLPSNTGAGYVIRRILRRAIRYGYTFLNQKEPFIYKLIPTLSEQLGQVYPELAQQQQLAQNVIKQEEKSFLATLEQGLKLLKSAITSSSAKGKISGKKAFELYDTYGFPLDLTTLIAKENKMDVDNEEFDVEMQKQKNRSRDASKNNIDDWVVLQEDAIQEFVGYDTLSTKVKIVQYRKVEMPKQGIIYQLKFNLTPFYPESGGQVGDKGYLKSSDGDVSYIIDTKKENNTIIHWVKTLPKDLNQTFEASVDIKQRNRTSSNHTATHLLHQALRSILGTHVEQKGSTVHSGEFRFDFSHFSKVFDEEILLIEQFVNARIREQIALNERRNVPVSEALEEGAIALFGEKYEDTVRVIQFGLSKELCGGTHVKNTADIWYFKVINETAVASGVRRIEAITGDACKKYFEAQTKSFDGIKKELKNPIEPLKIIQKLKNENVELKKKVTLLEKVQAESIKENLEKKIHLLANGISLIKSENILDISSNNLKDIAFKIRNNYDNTVFIGATKSGEKIILSGSISPNLEKKGFSANTLINEIAPCIGGKGGGQASFATAGGNNPKGLAEALNRAEKIINNH